MGAVGAVAMPTGALREGGGRGRLRRRLATPAAVTVTELSLVSLVLRAPIRKLQQSEETASGLGPDSAGFCSGDCSLTTLRGESVRLLAPSSAASGPPVLSKRGDTSSARIHLIQLCCWHLLSNRPWPSRATGDS